MIGDLLAGKNMPYIISTAVPSLAVTTNGFVFEPIIIVSVIIGLLGGALWRLSGLVKESKSTKEIKSDFFVSLLAGTANTIICLVVIEYYDATPLFALGIAVLVGATGTEAVKFAIGWARKKLNLLLAPTTPDPE